MSSTHEVLHTLNALATTSKVRAERNSDRPDMRELVDRLMTLAAELRNKYGMYDKYELLIAAVDELESVEAEIDEARETVDRLVNVEIRDLRDQLATYRVVEVVAATRETPAEYGVRSVADPDEGRD